MITAPVVILAVDDARLVRMKLQTDLRQPPRDRVAHLTGLLLADAVHHRAVTIPLEPQIGYSRAIQESTLVYEQISQQGGNYASNALGNFCFDVALSYRRLERPRRVDNGA
jgi:hypothetical protein